MITRRGCIQLTVLGGAGFLLSGHMPYKQWAVYRSQRLMIVASRSEEAAFPLAKALVAELEAKIPRARPDATRAPSILHVTRLLLTQQIQIAVMTEDQARLMASGEGEAGYEGAVPLRVLAFLSEPYVLVSHADFADDRARLIAASLFGKHRSTLISPRLSSPQAMRRRAEELRIPLHQGTEKYLFNPPSDAPAP